MTMSWPHVSSMTKQWIHNSPQHLENRKITTQYLENGMTYLTLSDILNLPNLNKECGEALLSDSMNVDPLDLLHERCNHYSKSKLLELLFYWQWTDQSSSLRGIRYFIHCLIDCTNARVLPLQSNTILRLH